MAASMRRCWLTAAKTFRKLPSRYPGRCFSTPHALYSTQLSKVSIEEKADYPPVKPRFPPGEWGYMTPEVAWQWQNEMDQLLAVPSVNGRIDKLCKIPARPIWSLSPIIDFPGILDYQLYLTKTHLVKGLPDFYQSVNIEEEFQTAKDIVIDHILLENGHLDRRKTLTKLRVQSWYHPSIRSQYFINQILGSLMSYLSGHHDYLLRGQYDEDVRVAAHFHRHGIPKKGKQHPLYPRPQHSPFQIDHKAGCQIRVEKPLKPFLSRDDEVCLKGEYPQYCYYPRVMGLHSQFIEPAIIPGHWSEDPCNFGLVSAHATNLADQQSYSPDVIKDVRTGCGLITSFAWQVALAHYQGFNMYLDTTYPFSGQTILTDGKRFTFYAYQLNTLHLWKDDASNPYRNICWESEDMHLFESVEGNKVIGFNDEVLRILLKFLLNEPRTDDLNVKPTLPVDKLEESELTVMTIPDKLPPAEPEKERPLYEI